MWATTINAFDFFHLIIYLTYYEKNKYLKIIDKIQMIRSKNNVNWMNILRLAFELDPKSSIKIMKKINYDDKRIASLLNKLTK